MAVTSNAELAEELRDIFGPSNTKVRSSKHLITLVISVIARERRMTAKEVHEMYKKGYMGRMPIGGSGGRKPSIKVKGITQIAEELGMSYQTLRKRMDNPQKFILEELIELDRILEKEKQDVGN